MTSNQIFAIVGASLAGAMAAETHLERGVELLRRRDGVLGLRDALGRGRVPARASQSTPRACETRTSR
jgi:hypothetical protein